MSNKFSKFDNGFSMTELLIVMAIIIIMTGVLLVGQSSNKSDTDVESATRQVAAQIRALQNEALNGKKIDTNGDGISDQAVCIMRFSATPTDPTKSYKIGYHKCDETLIAGSEQDFLIGKSLPSKPIITPAGSYVQFSSPVAIMTNNLPASGTAKKITIASSNGMKTNLVCIYDNGSVIETKEAVCP